jgi:hypothetical protein
MEILVLLDSGVVVEGKAGLRFRTAIAGSNIIHQYEA